MKHLYSFLIIIFMGSITQVNAQTHCIPASNSGCDAKIVSITSAVLPALNQALDTCNDAGYIDFTANQVVVGFGISIDLDITLEHALSQRPEVRVYLDINGDGDFTDPNENRRLSALNDNRFLGVISIPLTATTGLKRLRIRVFDEVPTTNDACATIQTGQAIDFELKINGVSGNLLPACVNANDIFPSNNSNNNCFSNIHFQWQEVWSNNPLVLDSLYYVLKVFRAGSTQPVIQENTFSTEISPTYTWERNQTYEWVVEVGNTLGIKLPCDTFRFTMPASLDPVIEINEKHVGICLSEPYSVAPFVQFGTAPRTYVWSGDGANFLSNAAINYPEFFPTAAGQYQLILQVTDANNCKAIDTLVVTADVLPEYGAVAVVDEQVCPGEKVKVLAANTDADIKVLGQFNNSYHAFAYSLFTDDTLLITPQNSAQQIFIEFTNGMCRDTVLAGAVFVSAASDDPIIDFLVGDTKACTGETVELRAENYTQGITWNDVNATAGRVVQITKNGTYQATYTDAVGCTFLSNKKKIVFKSYPKPKIEQVGKACIGDTVMLTSSVNNVTWNDADQTTGKTLQVVQSGTFQVEYENDYCYKISDPFEVSFLPYPSKPGIVKSRYDTVCEGVPVFLYTNSPHDVLWSNGGNKTEIIAQETDDYFLFAENENGCKTYSDTLAVVFYPTPEAPSITHQAETLLVSNDYDRYKWYGPDGLIPSVENWILVNEIGEYYVIVTDHNGCTAEPSEPFVFDPTGVETLGNQQFQVYPNPSNGNISLVNEAPTEETFGVYNYSGKLVQVITVLPAETKKVELHLTSGIYILKSSSNPLHFSKILQIQK